MRKRSVVSPFESKGQSLVPFLTISLPYIRLPCSTPVHFIYEIMPIVERHGIVKVVIPVIQRMNISIYEREVAMLTGKLRPAMTRGARKV